MNSCFYRLKISHKRERPKKNYFKYSIYMMYLDLDELEYLNKKLFLFSYNKWNILSFFDKDHFKFLNNKNEVENEISKENIDYKPEDYLNKNTKERIKLISIYRSGELSDFDPLPCIITWNGCMT